MKRWSGDISIEKLNERIAAQLVIEGKANNSAMTGLFGGDSYESRFAISQVVWLGLIVAAAGISALIDQDSLYLAGAGAAFAALPAALGLALTPAIRTEWAAALVSSAWIALGAAAAASTGGAASPFSVLLLAPAGIALLLGRRSLAKEAALMGGLAFAGCLIANILGYIDPRADDFAVAPGLGGLASLTYVAGLFLARQANVVEGVTAQDLNESANAGLGPRYLAELAHELKTPLNAIIGFADVMRQSIFGKLPDKYAEYVETIHQSGNHMLELVTNMLDLSRIRAGGYVINPEVIDARVVVTETVQMMRDAARAAGVSLIAPGAPEPLRVRADKTALKQILTNLIVNGLKYTPPGGSVTVRADGNSSLLLTVADTGVGIPQDALERVMKPFEQGVAAKPGAGLGLAVVRSLAQLHGGTVAIESPPGLGATVTVNLPVLVKTGA
jgi:signal transduction histidine kinase